MTKVIVDENIPIPSRFYVPDVEIIRVSGRSLKLEHLREADALLVRSVTKVDRDLLEGSSVKFVASATAGVDHLDMEYLRDRAIPCVYAAGSNAQSVVDYVFCSLAAIGLDPRERNFGIVGCGQVGGQLYQALQKLNAQCLCYDPFLASEQQSNLVGLDEVLASEVICLHTPLTVAGQYPTKNMLSYDQLIQVPQGALLINAGRGEVINEEDLKRVLKIRPDIRLIFDVWSGEPSIDTDIVDACEIATPHIAGYSAGAKSRGSQFVFEALFNQFNIPFEPEIVRTENLCNIESEDWSAALLEVYDPRRDDAVLRASLSAGGEGFDFLRKNYAHRTEVSEFSSDSSKLQAFGFLKPEL